MRSTAVRAGAGCSSWSPSSAIVLVVGIPLAAVLGVPVTSVILGILGPFAPLLFGLFYLMSIPIFAFLDFLVGLINPRGVSLPSISVPTPIGSGPPPLFERPTGAPPDLTWFLIVLVFVGVFILLRIVASFLSKPTVGDGTGAALETRASEPISLPHLPTIRRPRLPGRRQTPRTASEAYRLSLVALAGRSEGRVAGETPREHATRIGATGVGRDIGQTGHRLPAGRVRRGQADGHRDTPRIGALAPGSAPGQAGARNAATMRPMYQPAHGKFVVDDPADLLARLCREPAGNAGHDLRGRLAAYIDPAHAFRSGCG